MLDRRPGISHVRLATGLGLVLAACSPGGDTTSDASASTTGSASSSTSTSGDATGTPTTSDATGDPTATSGDSATGSTTTATTTTVSTTDVTTGSTGSTDPATSEPSTDSTQGVESGTTGGTSTTGTSTSDGSSTTDGSSTGEPVNCVPTELVAVRGDHRAPDCAAADDNVDAGNDGICDCLTIGILGASGFAPNANFEAWLEDQGSAVTRTLLLNNPGVVTPAFLSQYDLVLVDRIERALAPAEAAALEAFVKDDGRGLITLIGYNFDNNNPAPERDRANTVLAPFGLAYQGGYFGNNVIPTFDQGHPVGEGIFDVNFAGGITPVDIGKQGVSEVFATVQMNTAGIAHQTAMEGGRVIVWGDEWLTFDSDWQGYVDVQDLWVNMVGWAKPQDFCGVPQ